MSEKRCREFIACEILEICVKGSNKTAIVYKANLNFRTLLLYVDPLVNNGLLNVTDGPSAIYTTTDKGCELLKRYRHLVEILNEIKDVISDQEGAP